MAGLFIGFLVEKCAASQNHREFDLGWHRSNTYLRSLMRKKSVEKTQADSGLT